MNTIKTEDKIEIKPGYKKTSIGIIPEDWEVKKLISQAYVDKENINSDFENEFINYVSLSDIKNGKILPKKIQFKSAPSRAKRITKKGDVLLATVRPNLKNFAIVDKENIIASTGFAVLGYKKMDLVYLYNFLYSHFAEKQYFALTVGSNYPALNSNDVKNLKIPIPPLPEQKAIADCLSTWDKGIAKLSALIASKKEQKKGLMQGLFSGKLKVENGELVKVEDEKLWLKGWKEIKLKKTAKFLRGKGLSKGAVIQNGKNKCILYGELYTKYNEIISKIYSRTDSTDGLPSKKYDILIPSSTTTSGIDLITASCVLENNVLLGGDLIVMRPDLNKINAKFFVYLFSNSLHKLILRYTQGVTIIHLYGKDLKEVKLNLPSIEEQAAIAEVLITADKEIELLEKKLEAFKIQKKGLMQVLLTGERRLV